ncbi:MAG: YkgJ family cysteine cluster protein [Desulfobacteraceae bacterium]|jgi:Fe-S-cluster containining protein
MDFEPYFEKYKALVNQVDAVFDKVEREYSECVACKKGCADCCHALFDLTLIEAIFIKSQFDKLIPQPLRDQIINRANESDRKVYKLKRTASKAYQEGKPEQEILEDMAHQRIRCPLLDDQNKCELYESRPITCRLYGIPTVIGDKAHTCGISHFEKGKQYPTVKLDAIQQKLYKISLDLARDIKSSYPKLAELLVPLSMALLTNYDDEYLGVESSEKTDGAQTEGE